MSFNFDFLNRLAAARRYLEEGDATLALKTIDTFLKSHPGHSEALSLRAQTNGELVRQFSSRAAAAVLEAETERNLRRRVSLLGQAAVLCPEEKRIQLLAALAENQRDVLMSLRTRSTFLERDLFPVEAASQWESLRQIVPGDIDADEFLQLMEFPETPSIAAPAVQQSKLRVLKSLFSRIPLKWFVLVAFAGIAFAAVLLTGFAKPEDPPRGTSVKKPQSPSSTPVSGDYQLGFGGFKVLIRLPGCATS